jgi:hypothetical protein
MRSSTASKLAGGAARVCRMAVTVPPTPHRIAKPAAKPIIDLVLESP